MAFQQKWMKRGVIGIIIAGIVCLIVEPLIALIGILGVGWFVANQGYFAVAILAILGSIVIMLWWRKHSNRRLRSQ